MNQCKFWLYQLLDNIMIMKFILLFIVSFLAINGFGQPPENSNSNTTISNQGIYQEEETESIDVRMDSVPIRNKQESRDIKKDKASGRIQTKPRSSVFYKAQSSQLLESESKKVKYQSFSRTPSVESQKVMDSEVEQLRTIDDESFEYHLYNYVSGNYDVSRQESLFNAASIDGNNKEVQRLMVANSIVTGDESATKKGLVKLVKNGTLSKETISYTEDVLKSANGNDILITHGTNDSYGAIYNQLIDGLAFGSICIISLDLMKSSSYRELIRAKGFKVPKREVVDIQFFTELCNLNRNKGVSISMTLPLAYLKPIASKLVPYGLVLRTGNQKPLCASDLESLWNNEFNKKNLTEFTSAESRNYAKNYRPTKVILEEFHDSNKSNHYMKSSGQKSKKVNKKGN
jgi:hypothetical protein